MYNPSQKESGMDAQAANTIWVVNEFAEAELGDRTGPVVVW